MKAVGMLIALAFLLTLEDSQRVRRGRDLGCYVPETRTEELRPE